MQLLKRTIVIPCYNEAYRFPYEKYKSFLQENNFYTIFVNDGSTDTTNEVLRNLAQEVPDYVEVIELPINSGKAEAVRQGIMKALETSQFVAFIDADEAVSLLELKTMFTEIEKYNFIFGSRIQTLNSNIERSRARHYLSRIFATIVSFTIDLPVYDSQCGVKIFKKELAEKLFATPFHSRWLFDVEIFLRLKKLYSNHEIKKLVFEYPLKNWQEIKGSRLRCGDFIKAPLMLRQIKKRYK